nr:Chain A, peptide 3967 [Hirudo medicinalis]
FRIMRILRVLKL